MDMMGAELLFMVRNTKQTTLPDTCAHSLNMMYRVLFVFLEIDQSSKCFQLSEKVRKKMLNCLVFFDKVGFLLKESINESIFFQQMNMQFSHIRFYCGTNNKYIVESSNEITAVDLSVDHSLKFLFIKIVRNFQRCVVQQTNL